jgi:hypothetical protein
VLRLAIHVLRLAILMCLIVSANPAGAQPADPREKDPVFLEMRRLLTIQTECFGKQAEPVAASKADLETAAHEVPGRADETQTYKTFLARINAQPPAQFEEYWKNEIETRDLQRVKKLIGNFRGK